MIVGGIPTKRSKHLNFSNPDCVLCRCVGSPDDMVHLPFCSFIHQRAAIWGEQAPTSTVKSDMVEWFLNTRGSSIMARLIHATATVHNFALHEGASDPVEVLHSAFDAAMASNRSRDASRSSQSAQAPSNPAPRTINPVRSAPYWLADFS